MTVRDSQFEALLDAAESEPVEFDGLSVAASEGEYSLETPEQSRHGLSESELREAAEDAAAYVTNWHYWERTVGAGRHRRAFLRWVEGAAEHSVPERYEALERGVAVEWGQLAVSVELGPDGERRYDVRHVEDADASPEELDVYEDPLDLREVTTYDERGRYRPLKTAPTLVSGWALPDVDGRDAVEAVDTVYPATVANWNLEREGELDVSHWRDTAERQTGIYDIVDELPREAVEWVAETCCVDSQCLRRREWEFDEGEELDADGGDGPFPCREPCSLVVAAARQWTKLEREETRTYEFELTPSEKEQLEAIVDAVADGRTEEIREADVYEGANRYRARYLRAKRFDEEGNLSGTPTHPDGDGEAEPAHGDD
ncbi:DR2241 family protein [Halopelagius longus]|uniref:Uncharacterized protein n=1 Tax=Halopelagius longus TaxID=1236180 RepID=A0A370IL19_9EURY|nr:DR2241 family protein [Halopelagius longus]RDI70851.1 hypothetical protein DWB78_03425 [Halopelagius longus]